MAERARRLQALHSQRKRDPVAAKSARPYLNYNYDTKIDRDSQISIDIWDKFRYLAKSLFLCNQKALYFLLAFKEIERSLSHRPGGFTFAIIGNFPPFSPFGNIKSIL